MIGETEMIYLFMALYQEAQGLISHYQLKKDTANSRFQVFCSEESKLCITVTGPGEVAAACAVGCICTRYHAGRGDFLINIGACAANLPTGSIFLCNKLVEEETGKTFYPDVLYRHSFPEGCVVTGRKVLRASADMDIRTENREREAVVYDMEAAAVYQAGAYFFGPHQMSFLKIVSDQGAEENVSRENIQNILEENQKGIVDYIEMLLSCSAGLREECSTKLSDYIDQDRLCADFHCSQVMRMGLQQYIRYCELAGIDYGSKIKAMYEDGRLPCRDKREGKVRLEELKRELL